MADPVEYCLRCGWADGTNSDCYYCVTHPLWGVPPNERPKRTKDTTC